MVAWETLPLADQPPYIRDYAEIWPEADKIVYSSTLDAVSSARTRIERAFDPEAVRQMKAGTERDLTIGGPDLAAQAFKAGLVDACHLFLAPIVVGGGTQSLPADVRLELELVDERRFTNGTVYLHYSVNQTADGGQRVTPLGPVLRNVVVGEAMDLTRIGRSSASVSSRNESPRISPGSSSGWPRYWADVVQARGPSLRRREPAPPRRG
jgi:dihydrofolate reductase